MSGRERSHPKKKWSLIYDPEKGEGLLSLGPGLMGTAECIDSRETAVG
jgi:hypothetical protein